MFKKHQRNFSIQEAWPSKTVIERSNTAWGKKATKQSKHKPTNRITESCQNVINGLTTIILTDLFYHFHGSLNFVAHAACDIQRKYQSNLALKGKEFRKIVISKICLYITQEFLCIIISRTLPATF